jgi:hypothetical protein
VVPEVPEVPELPLVPEVRGAEVTIPSVAINTPFKSLIFTSPEKRPCIATV